MTAVRMPDDQMPGSANTQSPAEQADGVDWTSRFPPYDEAEVVADWIVHIGGIGLSVIGAIVIVVYAASNSDLPGIIATSLYAASLIAVFGFSAAYNHLPPSRTREILRRCDHASIYFLIAGTYSAIAFGRVDTPASHWPVIFAWAVAIAGAYLKIAYPRRFELASIVSYVVLGMIVFLSIIPLAGTFRPGVLTLITAGVILYTSGVLIHLWESLRFHNAIWHAMVLMAACCHFVALLLNM